MRRFFHRTDFRDSMGSWANSVAMPGIPLGRGRLWPKVVAIVVIVAMLQVVGVAPVVIVIVLALGVVFAVASWRAARRRTESIFGFYVFADEVLGDQERQRYRFEIADLIDAGERIVHAMPDPPPLASFALGALYSLIEDHNAVVEHLGIAAEEEELKKSSHASPSRDLRRYVRRLRQIERTPEHWPRIHLAVRNLERLHQLRAARMLAESQQYLKRLVEAYDAQNQNSEQVAPIFVERSLRSLTPPPPISQLLNDIYKEEQQTS